jgi:hypothetical protein
MSVGSTKASSFALKKETVIGDYLAPTAGTDFVPLRPGNELSYEPEQLTSDELQNDIGETKGATGKEIVKGKHSAYLKHSGVEGDEPALGILWESLLGSKTVNAVEYATVSSSTSTVIKVSNGASFYVGQALLIKDSTNGYSLRNIKSIATNDLTLNFELDAAPASGVNLGKVITYIPVSSGHPTFSTTKYLGGGFAIEASAGNTVTELSVKADANGYAEAEFSYEGTKYFYNALIVTNSNKYIDFTDDAGTFAAQVAVQTYKTPMDLAVAIELALNAASTKTYTCVYLNDTGKFTISSDSTVLSLLWNTGANTANSIKTLIGFANTDDTGATSYTSDVELSYSPSVTPSYENAENIVVKGAELFVGSPTDNMCICAQAVSVKITKAVEDVDCICEETGISEKIATGRSVELTATATMKKHDVNLLDALLNNKSISAMLNVGPKSAGNWVAGKSVNFYLKNCTVSAFKTTGESFLQVDITLRGFVATGEKDIYVNFV